MYKTSCHGKLLCGGKHIVVGVDSDSRNVDAGIRWVQDGNRIVGLSLQEALRDCKNCILVRSNDGIQDGVVSSRCQRVSVDRSWRHT